MILCGYGLFKSVSRLPGQSTRTSSLLARRHYHHGPVTLPCAPPTQTTKSHRGGARRYSPRYSFYVATSPLPRTPSPGPTAFGRIPGFTDNIFPAVSIPYLTLVADIGLCLFLFIVGLEIDTNIVKRNARMSFIISLAGIALPFGLGTALSVPLYHHFIDPSVHFTYFMLFTGVAYSITAFPVLCRILTELKLLDTNVGIIVLSAGVGNDIVGWTLLALSVALVNASSGLSALWILLVCVAFTIFLLIPVKWVMRWLARKTGSIENGPTMFYMTIVIILVWACAFFTDSIGVNAIFGASDAL